MRNLHEQQEIEDGNEEFDYELERQEYFFDMVDSQMKEFKAHVEKKIESVRLERESVNNTISKIVQELYKATQSKNFVNTKIYGSMASSLAIDSSDLDLAVVGLEFQGNKDVQIKEMKRLIDNLKLLMKTIHKCEFIQTA
jgi:DNA polymerase sigma